MKKHKTPRQERLVSFLTQAMAEKETGLRELSKKSNISPGHLSHFLNFNTGIPSDEKLISIAKALKIKPRVILAEAGRVEENDSEMYGLMRAFGELDDEDRRQVRQIVERYRKTGG